MTLKEQYINIRSHTETLCKPLRNEDYVSQPVYFASPPKWHLAHLTWFFEEFVVKTFKKDYQVINAQFNFLFNSYYNHAGKRVQRSNRGGIIRPTVEEVFEYRKYIDEVMLDLIDTLDDPVFKELVILGLNHEQQHQELFMTDLKHTWGHSPTWPIYDQKADLVNSPCGKLGSVKINEGLYKIGYNGDGFCFDNELGRHQVYLNSFEISTALISNAEFIEFIQDGGYQNFNCWLDEGWTWINEQDVQAPLYWIKQDDQWWNYTLAGLKPVQYGAAVCHLSFFEAWAFAEWSGKRLPTEFEWEVAADQFDWGTRWEWTNSAYLPYPNFKKAPGAIGEYNGKFMINQMVLRGASVVTALNHSRKTYRNFFHPPERWQFTGLRIANDI